MKTTTVAIAIAALAMTAATVNAAAPKMANHKMGHAKMGHAKMAHPKVAAATKYTCVKCHMEYSAKDAKAAKYKCEMDGGKLVAVKPASKMKPMHHM